MWQTHLSFAPRAKSQLSVYRCRTCHTVSHLSPNTIFQQCHLAPPQVVFFLRGVLKGEASITLAAALSVSPRETRGSIGSAASSSEQATWAWNLRQ
jgi:hypothetical protein